MSNNDTSGSYDKPDYDYRDDSSHDTTTAAAGKGGKASKWAVGFVALVGGLGALGAIFGDVLPKCNSTISLGMIEDLYLQVPLNTAQATVSDLTGITETAYDEDAKVRSCQATLIDSAGAQHAIVWSTTDAGETYNYEMEVQS